MNTILQEKAKRLIIQKNHHTLILLLVLSLTKFTLSSQEPWSSIELESPEKYFSQCQVTTKNSTYLLLGKDFNYRLYTVLNKEQKSPKLIQLPEETPKIENEAGCVSTGQSRVITITNKINILNFKNYEENEKVGLKQLEIDTGNGAKYHTLSLISETNYILVGSQREILGSVLKILKIETITFENDYFIEYSNTMPYGSEALCHVKSSPNNFITTPRVVKSLSRVVYDHTVSRSTILKKHEKSLGYVLENVLISSSKDKDLYLTVSIPDQDYSVPKLSKVRFTTGKEISLVDVPSSNSSLIYTGTNLEGTDLLFLTSKTEKEILVVDFNNLENGEFERIEVGEGGQKQVSRLPNTRLLTFIDPSEESPKIELLIEESIPCHISCGQCDYLLGQNDCTSCKENSVLNEKTSSCDCISGYYFLTETGKCENCSEGCGLCNGLEKCLECQDGYEMGKDEVCINCLEFPYKCVQDLDLMIFKGDNIFSEVKKNKKVFSFFLESSLDLEKKINKEIHLLGIDKILELEVVFEENDKLEKFVMNEFDIELVDPKKIKVSFTPKNITNFEKSKEILLNFQELTQEQKLKFQEKKINLNLKKNPQKFEKKENPIPNKNTVELPGSLKIVEDAPVGETAAFGAGGSFILQQFKIGPTAIKLYEYFQIMDILSNLGKINIEVGPDLDRIFEFVKKLKFPNVDKKNSLDLIGDDDAYLKYRKGGRGNTGGMNKHIFLASGQNFFFSVSTIIFFLGYLLSISFLAKNENVLLKIFSVVYRFLLNTFIFNFVSIAVVELESHSRSINEPLILNISFLISVFYLSIVVLEYSRAYRILTKETTKEKISKMSLNEKEILDAFTSKLEFDEGLKRFPRIIFIQQIKYLVLQLVIGGLPLSPRIQVTSSLVIEISFLVGFFSSCLKKNRKKVFKNCLMFWKIFSEEMCIILVLVTMAIFDYMKVDQERLGVYKSVEQIAVWSIIVTALFQILTMLIMIIVTLKAFIQKLKCRKKKLEEKVKRNFYVDHAVVETEAQNLDEQIEIEDDKKIDESKSGEWTIMKKKEKGCSGEEVGKLKLSSFVVRKDLSDDSILKGRSKKMRDEESGLRNEGVEFESFSFGKEERKIARALKLKKRSKIN